MKIFQTIVGVENLNLVSKTDLRAALPLAKPEPSPPVLDILGDWDRLDVPESLARVFRRDIKSMKRSNSSVMEGATSNPSDPPLPAIRRDGGDATSSCVVVQIGSLGDCCRICWMRDCSWSWLSPVRMFEWYSIAPAWHKGAECDHSVIGHGCVDIPVCSPAHCPRRPGRTRHAERR